MKKLLLIAGALGLAPVAAIAGSNDLTISYADLDLSQKSDVRILKQRVANAAARHCNAKIAPTGTRLVPQSNLKCAREFKAAAMKQFAALMENERKGG